MERVFVTGATGSVGQYVVDELVSAGCEVNSLVRPGARLTAPAIGPGILVRHEGVLESIRAHADAIRGCDVLVHLAAAWDDSPRAFEINVDRTLDLVGYCDPARCRRIVVFSTASIIGRNNELLAAAREHGTAYVRSKYEAYCRLDALPLRDRLVMVFPTLVFGGAPGRRESHVTREIRRARRYLWLARVLGAPGAFHFIHARDAAAVVQHLIGPDVLVRDVVLGQPAVSFDDALEAICLVMGWRRRAWFRLTPNRVLLACRLLGVRLSPWDRYSIEHPAFTHRVTRPEDVGLSSAYPTLTSVLLEALA
jgi:nucleoside-diphosphate-sugar epimerase